MRNESRQRSCAKSHVNSHIFLMARANFAVFRSLLTNTHDEPPGVSDYDKPAIIIVCNQRIDRGIRKSNDRTR